MFVNGASYGEKFPTVTRTMKYAVIDAEISVMEASGADPLSEGLAGSREKFQDDEEVEREDAENLAYQRVRGDV